MDEGRMQLAPQEPHHWPHAFTGCVNAGDIDGVLGLYAQDAQFVSRDGEVLRGHEAMRRVIGGLIEMHPRMSANVVRCAVMRDMALLYTDFTGSVRLPNGQISKIEQQAVEILRRQEDGAWLLVFGDPTGRGGDR